jgi:hypothetical protein
VNKNEALSMAVLIMHTEVIMRRPWEDGDAHHAQTMIGNQMQTKKQMTKQIVSLSVSMVGED